MKNKLLLKILSMGALSSLLVTPLVLNGVSDSVQEEVISQNVDDNQKIVKRRAVTDDTYSLESASTWANATYAKEDDGKYWLSGGAFNHSSESDFSDDLIRIRFNVKGGVDYTLKLGWGINHADENCGITLCGVPNIYGSSCTWSQAKLESQQNGGFQTEFCGDSTDEETYHFTGTATGVYYLVINADLYDDFSFFLKTELIQDDDNDDDKEYWYDWILNLLNKIVEFFKKLFSGGSGGTTGTTTTTTTSKKGV